MQKQKVLKHYITQRAIAEALFCTQQSVSEWGPIIPELSSRRLAALKNPLKFEFKYYPDCPEYKLNKLKTGKTNGRQTSTTAAKKRPTKKKE